MSLVTVTGNVLAFTGNQLGKRRTFSTSPGTVRLALVMPPRANQVPSDEATGHAVQVHYDVPVHWDGEFSLAVQPNDRIKPSGTVYSLVLMIPNVNMTPRFYIFEGTGPFNLNALTPVSDYEVRQRQVQELRDKIADLQNQLAALGGS